MFGRAFLEVCVRADAALLEPLFEPALAPALLLADFAGDARPVAPPPDLAPEPELPDFPFADLLAGFDTSPRRASPAMAPTADPNAAPALAGAPLRTSSRAAFRALLLATAVTTAAASASRTSGFFRSSLAFLPIVRARDLPADEPVDRVEAAFGLLVERLGVLAISHLRNGAHSLDNRRAARRGVP